VSEPETVVVPFDELPRLPASGLRYSWRVQAVEVVPPDPRVGSLHRRLIPCLGFAIGELFDFAALAAACHREQRYEFLFASVPLNLTGAVGSPANAVAIR
jgi:hypothetical protein